MLILATHPIWNVPPFVNAAKAFATCGFQSLVVGYQGQGLPAIERLEKDSWVLRLPLRCRNISLSSLRKASSLIEFQLAALRVVDKWKPDAVIAFNDPTTLILKSMRKKKIAKICWLLEYPEDNIEGFMEKMLQRACRKRWCHADIVVLPNQHRLALHSAVCPKLIEKTSFVIHNSPMRNEEQKSFDQIFPVF